MRADHMIGEENVSRASVAGVAAVALGLGGGRWGAYLGAPPLFLTDILIVLAVAHFYATRLKDDRKGLPILGRVRTLRSFGVLVIWAAVRFLAGGDFGLVALRDALPYLYAALGLLGGAAVVRATPGARLRAARLIRMALAFHAAWFFVVTMIWTDLPARLPLTSSGGMHVFTLRNDFDTAIVGVYAADLLVRIVRGDEHQQRRILGFALCWFSIIQTDSRAGLIGAAVVGSLALSAAFASGTVMSRRKVSLIAVLPIVLAAVFWSLPSTNIGQRLLGTFGLEQGDSARSAAGTANAREDSWDELIRYSQESPMRLIMGVGYGPDFMADSGAITLLIGEGVAGEAPPRSPHNYWLGTLLRGGLIGVALFSALTLAVLRVVRTRRKDIAGDPLLLFAALVPISLLVPMTLGVILESPFGAVPFFWCAGVLVAYPPAVKTVFPPSVTQTGTVTLR